MRQITSADANPRLAVALGRFSQACNHLEYTINFLLTRLLPLTTDMGRVLFAGNQMRRNIGILKGLMQLPEVPIVDSERARLLALIPRIDSINDDRSRLLHNRIIGGYSFVPGREPEPMALVVDKQDGRNSAALPITIELIEARAEEASILCGLLHINPVEYDLSQWTSEFARYPVKEYPVVRPSAPSHKRSKAVRSDQGRKS